VALTMKAQASSVPDRSLPRTPLRVNANPEWSRDEYDACGAGVYRLLE